MTQDAQTAFFSYCREDSEFVLQLAEDLKAAGANVWLDQLDIVPGQRWARAVQDALTNCHRLLVILSPSSVNSTNVEDEVAFALEEHKTVIPVLYRDCKVPFQLRPFQYVDFRNDRARGLKTLLKTLGVEQKTVAAAGAVVSAAPKESQTEVSDADERKRAEDGRRKAAEQERLEEERKRAAEQARVEEERRRAAEEARLEDERRKVAEQTQLEEQRKQAAERARAEEESKRAAEEARLEDERQRATEQTRMEQELQQAAEQARVEEESKRNREAEEARLEDERRKAAEDAERATLVSEQAEQETQEKLPNIGGIGALSIVAGALILVVAVAWLVFHSAASENSNPQPRGTPNENTGTASAEHWTVLTSGTLKDLSSIFGTSDGKRLWAVGNSPATILESDDGGEHWSPCHGAQNWLTSIFGTSDGRRLWAVGVTGLESDDGGAHWKAGITNDRGTLNSIFGTSDGRRLWVVGNDGAILESDDGGKHLSRRSSGTHNALNSIFSDGERLWAVGEKGTILASVDGGKNFSRRNSGTQNELQSIFGTGDGKRLWAVGGKVELSDVEDKPEATILESDDGGERWNPRESGTFEYLNSIFGTSDGRRLWAVGNEGTILESDDGGEHWNLLASGTPNSLSSIFGTSDGKRLWVVGNKGTILEATVP